MAVRPPGYAELIGHTVSPVSRGRGRSARRVECPGIFVHEGAHLEAEGINARTELIDGERLAQLLVRYGVGVQDEQTVTLYRLDEDFFETL